MIIYNWNMKFFAITVKYISGIFCWMQFVAELEVA